MARKKFMTTKCEGQGAIKYYITSRHRIVVEIRAKVLSWILKNRIETEFIKEK